LPANDCFFRLAARALPLAWAEKGKRTFRFGGCCGWGESSVLINLRSGGWESFSMPHYGTVF
jgi:hypothetical protein